ncbi:septum site-determining protein Ssd [Aldersonia kunmingensis]|uniref:septum site-determining protein Ssd n=1 Tax=Aldersonia kunmingensis TaxID=408066 RepID=UPI0009FEF2BA|nr:septum site-determining protein Ssd [Aldersonia kunmingensis]
MTSAEPDPRAVLVMVSGGGLLDEIRRIGAATECPMTEPAPPPGRQAWTRARSIVLDSSTAAACVRERLPRRPGIVLVSEGAPGLAQWQVATAVGAERVIALPEEAPELVRALAQRPAGGGGGRVIAVLGGRGGAGASTFAAALACAADNLQRTLLVDCDPSGGGLDLLLGIENKPGLRWPGLVVEDGHVSADALHHALPVANQRISVLSCGRGTAAVELRPAAVQAVLDAGREADDLVICDVARDRGPTSAAILSCADLVVLIVPAELRAVAAAESAVGFVSSHNIRTVAVVRGPAPGGLSADDVSDALGIPLVAHMRPEPRLCGQLERGGLRLGRRGPLRRAANKVLDALFERVDASDSGWVA